MTYRELLALLERFKSVESVAAELHVTGHPHDEPIPAEHQTRIDAALNSKAQ
jgi:hypothetical protein